MVKCRKRQEIVEARELREEETILTSEGVQAGSVGDFVVKRSDGFLSLIKRERFLDFYEEIEDIEGQGERVDIGVTGRTLAWAGAFSALLDKLVGHPRSALRGKAGELKQTDGEGWVAGELLESMCIYADAVDAQFGRVRIAGPDKPAIPCDCETCEEEEAKRAGPWAPQGDSGSGSI